MKREVESIMEDCNLKYRKDKGYNDLISAIGSVSPTIKTMDEYLDKGAEAIDRVLTIRKWMTGK